METEAPVRRPARGEITPPQPLTRPQPLKEAERQIIREALDYARGNISRTASLLEISRPSLYRRIEKLGISRNGNWSRKSARALGPLR